MVFAEAVQSGVKSSSKEYRGGDGGDGIVGFATGEGCHFESWFDVFLTWEGVCDDDGGEAHNGAVAGRVGFGVVFRNDWVADEFVDSAGGLPADVCGGFVVVSAVTFFGPSAKALHDVVGIVALVYE